MVSRHSLSSPPLLFALAWLLALSGGMAHAQAMRISPDDPATLKPGIMAAYQAGEKSITIPPGVYRLAPPEKGSCLAFAHMHDFAIHAEGVTLLRTDATRTGVEFYQCNNVAFTGATVRNETIPRTQAIITAIDPDGKWYDIRIEKGYPTNFDDAKYFPSNPVGYIFDPHTRQWKPGTIDLYPKNADRLGADTFRLHFANPVHQPVALGDLMAFRGKGATDIYLGQCGEMRITGVTILNASGFCVFEDGGDGGNYYSYKLTYGPKPDGADTPPLMASNADGFHSNHMRKGPTLDGCSLEGMPDDGVPIHGTYAMVMAAAGNRLVLCNGGFFREGDALRLFTAAGVPAGEAVVKTVAPLTDYQPTRKTTKASFQDSKQFTAVTLDTPLRVGVDYLASDPNANGSGFVVRNCVIRNNRARGMLLKADNGLVENNTIDGSTIAGIIVGPELGWNESCYARNIVIRHNTIRHCGYAHTGPWDARAGAALTIAGEGDTAESTPGNQHIVIEDNTFRDNDGVNLLISSAQDVSVKHNRFENAQRTANRRGADAGIEPSALIWLSHSRDVRFAANEIVNRGSFGKVVVKATDHAENMTGLQDGVRVSEKRTRETRY